VTGVYLVFHSTLVRTICGFTSDQEMDRFLRYTIGKRIRGGSTVFDELPASDPRSNPIHVFDTAHEAAQWFTIPPDRWQPSDVAGISTPVWEGL
jgi:hypothetical protein